MVVNSLVEMSASDHMTSVVAGSRVSPKEFHNDRHKASVARGILTGESDFAAEKQPRTAIFCPHDIEICTSTELSLVFPVFSSGTRTPRSWESTSAAGSLNGFEIGLTVHPTL
jgi:hypothetical protein